MALEYPRMNGYKLCIKCALIPVIAYITRKPILKIPIYIYYSINYNIYFKLNIDIIDTNTDNQLVTRHKIDTSMSKNDTRVQIIK